MPFSLKAPTAGALCRSSVVVSGRRSSVVGRRLPAHEHEFPQMWENVGIPRQALSPPSSFLSVTNTFSM